MGQLKNTIFRDAMIDIPDPDLTKASEDDFKFLFANRRLEIPQKDGSIMSFSTTKEMTADEIVDVIEEAEITMAAWHKKYDAFIAEDYLTELIEKIREVQDVLSVELKEELLIGNKKAAKAFAMLDFALMHIPPHFHPTTRKSDAETV